MNGDYYALGANINASVTSEWNSGAGFAPVSVNDVFNGLGHTITGLTINRPGEDYIGLFKALGAVADASIRNVGLVGGSVTGRDYVGGLAGKNKSQISNSYNTGSVDGSTDVGGLVDGETDGTITNSYWDTQTSGRSNCVGSGSDSGCTGLTTAQMEAAGEL